MYEITKNVSLKNLLATRDNNYIGLSGKEYYSETVDMAIIEREQSKLENDMIASINSYNA